MYLFHVIHRNETTTNVISIAVSIDLIFFLSEFNFGIFSTSSDVVIKDISNEEDLSLKSKEMIKE